LGLPSFQWYDIGAFMMSFEPLILTPKLGPKLILEDQILTKLKIQIHQTHQLWRIRSPNP